MTEPDQYDEEWRQEFEHAEAETQASLGPGATAGKVAGVFAIVWGVGLAIFGYLSSVNVVRCRSGSAQDKAACASDVMHGVMISAASPVPLGFATAAVTAFAVAKRYRFAWVWALVGILVMTWLFAVGQSMISSAGAVG